MTLIRRVPFKEELRRNPELKATDIEILREWHSKQSHLPRITDSELALFLHSNYYRLEPTKITIDAFYTFRTRMPEFFSNRDPLGPKTLRRAFQVVTCIPLNQSTRDGYKIIFGRFLDTDPFQYTFNDCMKYFNMALDLWLYTEGTGKGHMILIDMEGITLGHLSKTNLTGVKRYLAYLQQGLPVRLKGIHFINATSLADVILNMLRPFVKKKLINLLHFHPSLNSLTKLVPLEVLPNDIGGKAGWLRDLHEEQIRMIEDHRAWYQEEEATARVSETLRPEKSKNMAYIFGVDGSFKHLEID